MRALLVLAPLGPASFGFEPCRGHTGQVVERAELGLQRLAQRLVLTWLGLGLGLG